MIVTLDQLYQSLSGLLPQGWAWPRDPKSVLMAVVRAKAGELLEHSQAVDAMVRQWQPAYTVARLAEWEACCGLPDLALGSSQTNAQRRSALLDRLRGPQLPYADSSLAAPGVIEAALAKQGIRAAVRYNKPMRVGQPIGHVMGALSGKLYVFVTVGSGVNNAFLRSYLDRIVPARFQINVLYF
jgi:hypothetical protein